MKRQLLIFLYILLWNSSAFSQPYTIWSKTYGSEEFEEFESLDTTSDGGIIAVGRAFRPFGIKYMSGPAQLMPNGQFLNHTFASVLSLRRSSDSQNDCGNLVIEEVDCSEIPTSVSRRIRNDGKYLS